MKPFSNSVCCSKQEEKDSRKSTRGAPRGRRKRRGDAALLRQSEFGQGDGHWESVPSGASGALKDGATGMPRSSHETIWLMFTNTVTQTHTNAHIHIYIHIDTHSYVYIAEEKPFRKKPCVLYLLYKCNLFVVFFFMTAVPYGGKKKSWCWASYLEQEKAIAAPSKLFKEVRPSLWTNKMTLPIVCPD